MWPHIRWHINLFLRHFCHTGIYSHDILQPFSHIWKMFRFFPWPVWVVRLCSAICVLHSRTVFELNLEDFRRARSILWVLGHQVQVNWSVTLDGDRKTFKVTLSISLTLFSVMNNHDLLRPHKKRKSEADRECIVRDDDRQLLKWLVSRKERMMREKRKGLKKPSGVKTKKKNQCSIFLLCLVSFSMCGFSPQGRAVKVEGR